MASFCKIPAIYNKTNKNYGLLKAIQDYSDTAYQQGYRAAKENIKRPSNMREAKKRFCLFYKISNIIDIVAPDESIKSTNKEEDLC